MADFNELTNEVIQIRNNANKLEANIISANKYLEKHTRFIESVVRGSRTGEDAAASLRSAITALNDVRVEVSVIQQKCEEYIRTQES